MFNASLLADAQAPAQPSLHAAASSHSCTPVCLVHLWLTSVEQRLNGCLPGGSGGGRKRVARRHLGEHQEEREREEAESRWRRPGFILLRPGHAWVGQVETVLPTFLVTEDWAERWLPCQRAVAVTAPLRNSPLLSRHCWKHLTRSFIARSPRV